VSDAPSGVDRLGCTIYAKAIAATAREAESPSASLCVGIYARWGGGKSFLWTLIQRTLLALALVETLGKLHEQAKDGACPSRAAAAAAFEKAVERLRDPEAKESAMVDEEDKLRFEKQRDKISAQAEPVSTCCPGGVTGGLSRAMISLVGLLVSLTAKCGASYTPKRGVVADQSPGYVSVLLHEPDSFMGQQEKRRQQSREAKAAETHAAAVGMLMFLLLPLLPLLLPLTSLGAAVGRCYDVWSNPLLHRLQQLSEQIESATEAWKRWQQLAVAIVLVVVAVLPLLLLLLPLLLIVLLVLVVRGGLSTMADPTDTHAKRVLTILLEQGDIGLGEMENSTVALTTTLRYAVLCIVQSAILCFASAMSLCSGLRTTGGDEEELPEGATKYLVVEFNAWVYSGVRAASVPLYGTHTYIHMHIQYLPHTSRMLSCRSPICCGRRSSRSSTIKLRKPSARRRCANTERASPSRTSCPPTRPRSSDRNAGAQCASVGSPPQSPPRAASLPPSGCISPSSSCSGCSCAHPMPSTQLQSSATARPRASRADACHRC